MASLPLEERGNKARGFRCRSEMLNAVRVIHVKLDVDGAKERVLDHVLRGFTLGELHRVVVPVHPFEGGKAANPQDSLSSVSRPV